MRTQWHHLLMHGAFVTSRFVGLTQSEKRKFKVPHTFVIITVIILAVTALTWIVPAGQYVRYEDPVSGQMLVDPEQFSYIEQTPVNPLLIPLYIVEAMCSRIDLMLPKLAAEAGATEELKAADPLKWTGLMNSCKAQAEEAVLNELIYN